MTFAIVAAFILNNYPVFGWDQIGHSTIAEVAQKHLTPEAEKALNKYLDDLKLAIIASDADIYRSQWTVDLGFVPTNPEAARVPWLKEFDFSTPPNIAPWTHSITVDMDFNCYPTENLDGAYINNAAYCVDKLAKELKDNEVKGHFFVEWKGKKHDMHVIWDGTLCDAYYKWSFLDMAYLVDTATPEEIAQITDGNIYDYASRSARDSWPAVSAYKEGDVLPRSYATDMRPLLFSQLRNGGYRLAAIFNEIFK